MTDDRKPRQERTRTASRWLQLVLFVMMLVLLGELSRPMLRWLRHMLLMPYNDMAHGWVVPFFSLFLVWRRRRALAAAAGSPSLAGILLCLPLLTLLWMGWRGEQPRLSQIAVCGLLWTIPYACFGLRLARLLLFPVAFLFFTVPTGILEFFTVRLRLATAWISALLLNGGGIPVARVGTGLHCLAGEGFALDVADPCSGLRSIFAMSAITAAYANLTLRTRWKQWLLFACSVPLAMLGNMARIFTIALIAQFFGQRVGTGFYHDYSGYLVFFVGTLLMMQAGAWIARLGGSCSEAAPPAPAAVTYAAPWWTWAGLALVPLAMIGMLSAFWRLPPPELEAQTFLAANLPELPGYRLAKPWYCQNEQCRKMFDHLAADPAAGRPLKCPACGGVLDEVSYGEHTYLPSDTLFLKGNYYDEFGNRLHVSVVVNGASRLSIHRPELCLPAHGYSIERVRDQDLPDGRGRRLRFKVIDYRPARSEQQDHAVQVYFFVSARHQTASHFVRILISSRDRALFNRVTRWAMVVLVGDSLFGTPERSEAVHSFLRDFNAALRDPAARAPTMAGMEHGR